VEEFVSCGVWPLAASVNSEQVKVNLTPISKLKVPLPRFSLSREDDEDDVKFLAWVEQEARVIVGSYMCMEHDTCIAGLQNNDRLNRVLKLTGVAYGPRPVPISVEVLKKRKADATGKVLVKHLKASEKKKVETTKVAAVQVKGGLKRLSDTDISSAKSGKLSKNTVPCAIGFVATTRITPEACSSKNVFGALGSKAGGGGPSSKTVASGKKITMSIKKRIVPAIGALAEIYSEGTLESSPHGQAPEV
jgi:hypothetical protein